MNKNPMENNDRWPIIDEPERAREADQINIVIALLRQALKDNDSYEITPGFVQQFLQVCDLAAVCEQQINGDSTYRFFDTSDLPPVIPREELLTLLGQLNEPRPLHLIPGVSDIAAVAADLKDYEWTGINEDLVIALDAACENVWPRREVAERCTTPLQDTDDAIQRASIYLEMGRESDAFAEFQKISKEEIANPENALDLVELVERYQSKAAALTILKRWFVSEIILHPVAFDLFADVILGNQTVRPSVRIAFLRETLENARFEPFDSIRERMQIALPSRIDFPIDRQSIDERLAALMLTAQDLAINLEDYEDTDRIDFYEYLMAICEQTHHLAILSLQTGNRKMALNIIERLVLACFILIALPERIGDLNQVPGYGMYNAMHESMVGFLRDHFDVLETLKPEKYFELARFDRMHQQFSAIRGILEYCSRARPFNRKESSSP